MKFRVRRRGSRDQALWKELLKELRTFLIRFATERLKTKLAGAAIVGAVTSTQVADPTTDSKPPPPPPPPRTVAQEKAPA